MAYSYYLFVISGFLAVVLLLEGAYVYWSDTRSPEVKRVQTRLRLLTVGPIGGAESQLLKQRRLSQAEELHRWLEKVPGIEVLDHLLQQAGYTKTLAHFLMVSVLAGAGVIAAGVLLGWPATWSTALGLTTLPLAIARLGWMRTRRIHHITAQLPAALDMISRALRAGHAFSATLSMVGSQAQEPIATEFRATFSEINFGISTHDALLNLAKRVPTTDMRYFVMAVIIQLETGGNLAELLAMLGNLIRDRFKLLGKIQVMAAEGKLSAYILIALPFLVAGAIQTVSPRYLNVMLTDPTGLRLVEVALIMMLLGAFTIWRLIQVRI